MTRPETVIIELTPTEIATIRDALDARLVAMYATAVRARIIEAQSSLDRQTKP